MTTRQRDPVLPSRRAAQWVCHGLAVGALAMGMGGVPADASAPASAPPGPAGERTLAQIEALIVNATCTSDSQCRVAGIGARPCGGPESYRAWSTQSTRVEALEQQLQNYAVERQRWNEKVGLMSTCDFRPAPGARCEREGTRPGKCVLVPKGEGLR